jgi:hypothetical protein
LYELAREEESRRIKWNADVVNPWIVETFEPDAVQESLLMAALRSLVAKGGPDVPAVTELKQKMEG